MALGLATPPPILHDNLKMFAAPVPAYRRLRGTLLAGEQMRHNVAAIAVAESYIDGAEGEPPLFYDEDTVSNVSASGLKEIAFKYSCGMLI